MRRLAPLALALVCVCSGPTPHAQAPKPNILLIQADDLGYGDLGAYGQAMFQTPNVDRLAKSGLRFISYYAGSTVCAPSRAALMTGLHTGHGWIRGNLAGNSLRDQDRTIASVLKDAGYRTALIGKWGLGESESPGRPDRKGFEYSFGYLSQTHGQAHSLRLIRLICINSSLLSRPADFYATLLCFVRHLERNRVI